MSRNGAIVSVVSDRHLTSAIEGVETIETSHDIASKHRADKSPADVAQRGAQQGDQ
jgi:hypothetical protein